VLELDIAIPDHTTLSRRGGGLTILLKTVGREEPLHLLVDSTGLKIYGEGEWLDQKRGIRSPRRWRKLHLGVDADTHEIVAAELTPDDVGDVSELPDLLDQVDAGIASLTADGAYDGEVAYDAVANRHPDAAIIIPPRATAVPNETTVTQRDRHITTIGGEDGVIPQFLGTPEIRSARVEGHGARRKGTQLSLDRARGGAEQASAKAPTISIAVSPLSW
jgi:hypothetical protein